jgi:fructose-bisphosphate aldolase, class I
MFLICVTYSYHVTSPESNQIETIAAAARIGTELGADIIKTRLTGDQEDVRIIEAAKRPVLVLGGPKTEHILDYFKFVKHCMDVGAKGVAVGRNITLDENPLGVVAGLNKIIHQNGSAEEACQTYQSSIALIQA